MDIDPNQPYTYTLDQERARREPRRGRGPAPRRVEVMVLWDTNVLHVAHLDAAALVLRGRGAGEQVACDFFIPSETLGTTRAPVVVARGVSAALVMLPRSTGYGRHPRAGASDVPGPHRVRARAAVGRAVGRARVSSCPPGAKARMELEGSRLVFQVAAVNAGQAGRRRARSRASSRPRACTSASRSSCTWASSRRWRSSCRA